LLGRTISWLLTTIALLLVLAICRLLTVSVLLLVRILVRRDLLVLLRRWVGRVAAVWIIALVILTLRRCVVALLLVLIMGRCLVWALFGVNYCSK
jgi:hypothetical protein